MTAKPHAAPENTLARTGQGGVARGRKGPRGYGAMRDVPLNLDPRIDLTQPIYEQVLTLEKADKDAAGTFDRELRRLLQDAGCNFVRPAKGSHELWWSLIKQTQFTVPQGIVSRHTANAVLKQAGLPKSF